MCEHVWACFIHSFFQTTLFRVINICCDRHPPPFSEWPTSNNECHTKLQGEGWFYSSFYSSSLASALTTLCFPLYHSRHPLLGTLKTRDKCFHSIVSGGYVGVTEEQSAVLFSLMKAMLHRWLNVLLMSLFYIHNFVFWYSDKTWELVRFFLQIILLLPFKWILSVLSAPMHLHLQTYVYEAYVLLGKRKKSRSAAFAAQQVCLLQWFRRHLLVK